jgi:hypothetical protein
MPIGVTKVHGSSAGVNNVGSGQSPPITAYKITALGATANLAAELDDPSGAGVVGAVETLMKVITTNASVLAYQVDSNGSTAQLSVLVERSSWADADLQVAIRALGGNIGSRGNVFPALATVSSTGGIKLA